MPKIKNLAALVAAVEGARRYARSNPDKAAKYIDQAAAFLDKQTKGKYHGQVEGVVGKVKSAAGLPQSSGNGTQSYVANAGYGKHQGYGAQQAVAPDPLTTTAPSTTPSPTLPAARRAADGDDRVDHRAARLHPAHAGDGGPRAHRRQALPGQQGPLTGESPGGVVVSPPGPPPVRTPVVPR